MTHRYIRNSSWLKISWAVVLSVSLTSTLLAATDLSECVGIDDAGARLACYDKVAGRNTAVSSKTSPISQPSTYIATKNSTSNSGDQKIIDQNSKVAEFGRNIKPSPRPETIESIESTVTRTSSQGIGKVLLTLANGQHWVLSEDDGRVIAGSVVIINRGALGSFNLVTKDRHNYRVKRVD